MLAEDEADTTKAEVSASLFVRDDDSTLSVIGVSDVRRLSYNAAMAERKQKGLLRDLMRESTGTVLCVRVCAYDQLLATQNTLTVTTRQ